MQFLIVDSAPAVDGTEIAVSLLPTESLDSVLGQPCMISVLHNFIKNASLNKAYPFLQILSSLCAELILRIRIVPISTLGL